MSRSGQRSNPSRSSRSSTPISRSSRLVSKALAWEAVKPDKTATFSVDSASFALKSTKRARDIESTSPTRISGRRCRTISLNNGAIWRASASRLLPRCRNRPPARVSPIGRTARSNNCAPERASMSEIACETAGCDKLSCRAASVIEPVSHTARKICRLLKSKGRPSRRVVIGRSHHK